MSSNNLHIFNRAVRPDHGLNLHRARESHALGNLRVLRRHLHLNVASGRGGIRPTVFWPGERQQFGAEVNVGAIQRVMIDLELNFPVFEEQINHAALTQEILILANQKQVCPGSLGDRELGILAFRRAEEEQVTGRKLIVDAEMFNHDRMRLHAFATSEFFQHVDEVIAVPDYPYHKWRGSVRQRLTGPLRQFREIQKVSCFYLVLAGLCCRYRLGPNDNRKGKAGYCPP